MIHFRRRQDMGITEVTMDSALILFATLKLAAAQLSSMNTLYLLSFLGGAAMMLGLTHQPGQSAFKAITSEDIDWKPFPAFPPSVRLAVVVGEPSGEGPYVIRVKVPHDVKLMPHTHPEDRVYTVISGIFYIGLGDRFDADNLQAYPPSSVIILPGNTPHFHWAKTSEYVTQVNAIGPLGLYYVNPKDDPRMLEGGF